MKQSHPVNVRIPTDLYERIQAAAKPGRSMSAEIIARLESSFEVDRLNAEANRMQAVLETILTDSKRLRDQAADTARRLDALEAAVADERSKPSRKPGEIRASK